jgi:molybdopterin-containing oxidoreductase family iron-sulfur binding subunit
MHKLENGITMHDPKKCIGCKYCEFNCPYGVIYFNWETPHKFWRDKTAEIQGGTASPQEVVKDVRAKSVPYYNPERESTYAGIRPKGVVEKCTFCDHRVKKDLLPRCVEACQADARIFGDISDPKSDVSVLLGKFRSFRLREQIGTNPHVFYIRDFNPAAYQPTKGGV